MPFNGSGTYTRPAGQPVVAGTDILDTTFNNYTADVATALTNCVTRDGQSPATANLPMGGFKLTGVGNATATTDALTIAAVSAATTKSTPVDADELAIADSAASFGLKKLTWANLKATLKAYFDTLYAALSGTTFTGPVLFDTVADIASATSIDLTAYGSGTIATVTGTTATTTFVMSDGQTMTLVAAGAWPLTYHATTNKLVGGASVTAYAGQYLRVSKTGGVVSCEPIAPASIYGGMTLTAIADLAASTWTKLSVSAGASGNAGITFSDAGDTLTVIRSGVYHVDIAASYSNSAAAKRGEIALYVDGAISHATQTAIITTQVAAYAMRANKSFDISLTAGQVLTMYGWSVDANGAFAADENQISINYVGP